MSHSHHERIVCICGNVLMTCRCIEPKTDKIAPHPCRCNRPILGSAHLVPEAPPPANPRVEILEKVAEAARSAEREIELYFTVVLQRGGMMPDATKLAGAVRELRAALAALSAERKEK